MQSDNGLRIKYACFIDSVDTVLETGQTLNLCPAEPGYILALQTV